MMTKRIPISATISLICLLTILSVLLSASTGGAPLQATTINVDLTLAGGSTPYLDGGSWSTFDANQALPVKGGLVLAYEIPDFAAYPINTAAARVTLRPETNPASQINYCTNAAPPDPPAPGQLGTCYFQVIFNQVHIYYLGSLAAGEQIAYSVSGLQSADPANFTFADFDSTSTGGPMEPEPGRDPARLVLVLDKSGSMNWSSHPDDPGCNVYASPPPGCEPARWEILEQAVTQMLAVGQDYALPGDKLAAALFDSSVAASNTFDPFNLNDPINVSILENHLENVVSPGGRTSIGEGVKTFESVLTGPDAGDFNQYILLFTDGDQNEPAYLVTDATQVKINPNTNSPIGAGVYEFAPGVKICPFALRADDPAGTLGTTYLQSIADLRCKNEEGETIFNATMSIDPSDASLLQFFLEVLHEALIGDKLELAAVQSGQLAAGGPDFAEETFFVSRDDIAFTALISWAERFNGLSALALEKDGVIFQPPSQNAFMRFESGDSYAAITLRQPFCNNDGECVDGEGEWRLRMVPFYEVAKTFTYNLFLTTDNKTLASHFRATQATPGVGEPLTLEATLTEGGAPLTGLPDGSVKATVRRPTSGLGNVLSEAEVDLGQGPDSDPIAGSGLKASAMLADPGLRDTLLAALHPSALQTLTLVESSPGKYAATYNDAVAEGVYEINFFVDAETPDNGRFTRTFETGLYVPVVADEAATQASAIVSSLTPCDFSGGCYAIMVQPMDGAGNLLGPGKAPLFSLPDFNGQILKPFADNLDGTYTIKIGYPGAITENPTIDIYGVEITVEVKSESPIDVILDWIRMNPLWVLLLILLLLLLLLLCLVLCRRRRRSGG